MFKFKVPKGYNAWCMLCGKGFPSVDALGEHNRTNIEEHKRRSGKKEKKPEVQPEPVKPASIISPEKEQEVRAALGDALANQGDCLGPGA